MQGPTQTQALNNDIPRRLNNASQELSPAATTPSDFFPLPGTSVDSTGPCGLSIYSYGTTSIFDDIDFMGIENTYPPDLDPASSTAPQDHRPQNETAARIVHRLTPSSSSPRSNNSSNFTEHESLGTVVECKLDNSLGKAGWLSPLHIAVQRGHNKIVRVLLQHNVDCNVKDSDGLTPLIHATIGGYEDVVSSLLSHGAHIGSVDGNRRSALHLAVIHGHEALLKDLLSHRSCKKSLMDAYDKDGKTPLHMAVDLGFEAAVLALLQSGANVHCRAQKSSYEPS